MVHGDSPTAAGHHMMDANPRVAGRTPSAALTGPPSLSVTKLARGAHRLAEPVLCFYMAGHGITREGIRCTLIAGPTSTYSLVAPEWRGRRHMHYTSVWWRFAAGRFRGRGGWRFPIPPPTYLPFACGQQATGACGRGVRAVHCHRILGVAGHARLRLPTRRRHGSRPDSRRGAGAGRGAGAVRRGSGG